MARPGQWIPKDSKCRQIDKLRVEADKRDEEKLRAAECSEQFASGDAEDDEEWEVKSENNNYKLYMRSKQL